MEKTSQSECRIEKVRKKKDRKLYFQFKGCGYNSLVGLIQTVIV